MLAGALEIQMLADLARLTDDMGKAYGIVEKGTKKIQDVAGVAGKALGLIGVSLSAKAFAGWIQGGIDAADAAAQLSEKTGIAAEDLGGLQLAFKQAGLGGDAMSGSLSKMAKQMVDGNKGFDDLGVKTRNADGSMRSIKDVLYDTADAFEGLEGGATESALAQQIFGKSGADLLPILNGGSKGLIEMAEMAEKLGLVISTDTAESADKFNDTVELLSLGLTGVATQTAAKLLPTLSNLAGVFLDTMTSGDGLNKVASAMAVGLKGLVSAGLVVFEVFNSVGKTLGAAGAQIVAVLQGDFKRAAGIGQEYAKDIKTDWSATATSLAKVWDESGNKTIESLAGIQGAQRKLTLQSEADAAAAKKRADEKAALAKKEEEDYGKLIDKINDKIRVTEEETRLGRTLTESEKMALEVTQKYTGAKREQALAGLAQLGVVEKEQKASQEKIKTMEVVKDLSKKLTDVEVQRTAGLDAMVVADVASNAALRVQVEQVGLTGQALLAAKQAVAAREAAVLRATAADLDWQAGMEGGNLQLTEQAKLLRVRANLAEDRALLDAQKAYKEEWVQTNQQIGQSLTDALMQGGKSGWDYIKGLVRTTVLRPLVEFAAKPLTGLLQSALGSITGGLGSLLGMGNAVAGTGGVAGAGGGLFGSLGSMGSIITGGLGSFGSGLGAGFSALLGESGIAGALSAGATSIGAGSVMSGLGTIAGALGPIALGLGAVYALVKSVDHSGTQHTGSTAMADETGTRTTFGGATGINFLVNSNDRNAKVDDPVRGIAGAAAAVLNALGSSFGGKFSVATGYADDTSEDGAFGALKIARDGQSLLDWESGRTSKWAPKTFADGDAGWQQYLTAVASSTRDAIGSIGLPEWAKKTFDALGGAPTLEQMASAAQSIALTQASLTNMAGMFAPLGGVFGRIAGLSADAKIQLLEFAGGIEALAAKTQGYVANYYTEGEQASLSAAAIKSALESAGIVGAGSLSKRDEFKTLMNSVEVTTEAGRRQLVALLDVQESFAKLSDYIGTNGGTLESLAASAPQVALLQQSVDVQAAQVDAAQQTVTAINSVNTSIDAMRSAVVSSIDGLGGRIGSIVDAVDRSSRSMADAFFEAMPAGGVEP